MADDRQRLRAALLQEAPEPDAALEARILANRSKLAARGSRIAALGAGVLAVALVVGLLAAGHRLPMQYAAGQTAPRAGAPALGRPAAKPVPTPAATPAVPADDLAAAHLENVAQLIQPLHVTADSGGQTVELIGIYSDAVRTVFFVRCLPADGRTSFAVSDQQGLVNGSSGSGPAGSTDRILTVDAPLHALSDGSAQVTLNLQEYPQAVHGPISPIARWTLQATVQVGGGTAVVVPPLTLGGWTWEVTIEETPNAIEGVAIVDGATVDQLVGGPGQHPLTLAGPGGAAPPILSEGASVTVPKQQLNAITARNSRVQTIWLRGAKGTYQLTIHTPTGDRTIPIKVD